MIGGCWSSYAIAATGDRRYGSRGFEIVEAEEIAFFDGAQERGGGVEAVAGERAEAAVVLGGPGAAGIAGADNAGVVPIGFGDLGSIPIAVDGHEIAAGGIVDLQFGAAAEGVDGGDGGEDVAELAVGHGFCGVVIVGGDAGRVPTFAECFGGQVVGGAGVGLGYGFFLWAAELKRFLDSSFDEAGHAEWGAGRALTFEEGFLGELATFGCAILEDGRGEVNGIEDLDLAGFEFGGGIDAFKKLHQREQGVVGVFCGCCHGMFFGCSGSYGVAATGDRRHGSSRDATGFGCDGSEDAVAFAACGIEVGGF